MYSIVIVLLNTLKICKKEYVAGVINFGNEYLYDRTKQSEAEEVKDISSFNYKYLLVLMGVINLIGGGVFPGIQAFLLFILWIHGLPFNCNVNLGG